MEIIFTNQVPLNRAEPIQDNGAPIILTQEQINDGWNRLAANNLEALREAASRMP